MVDASCAWLTAWAKSLRDEHDLESVVAWLPLHVHLGDAAAVATILVRGWVSPLVVGRIADDLGGGSDDVATVVRWLAAVHDVGKISPAFAAQVPELTPLMGRHGLTVRGSAANV